MATEILLEQMKWCLVLYRLEPQALGQKILVYIYLRMQDLERPVYDFYAVMLLSLIHI